MSTFTYARLTTKRDQATQGESTTNEPPGLRAYVDALAALVPTEVLTVHAVVLPLTTELGKDKAGQAITTIVEQGTLRGTFYALIVLCVVIYLLGRGKAVDRLDWVRGAVPPIAFVAWTMIQRSTAFDAVSTLGETPRTVIAILIAVLLGLVSAGLAQYANNQPAK